MYKQEKNGQNWYIIYDQMLPLFNVTKSYLRDFLNVCYIFFNNQICDSYET